MDKYRKGDWASERTSERERKRFITYLEMKFLSEYTDKKFVSIIDWWQSFTLYDQNIVWNISHSFLNQFEPFNISYTWSAMRTNSFQTNSSIIFIRAKRFFSMLFKSLSKPIWSNFVKFRENQRINLIETTSQMPVVNNRVQ